MGKRDNDCFGSGIEEFHIHEEFDFEKNLALFDKVLILSFILWLKFKHGNNLARNILNEKTSKIFICFSG